MIRATTAWSVSLAAVAAVALVIVTSSPAAAGTTHDTSRFTEDFDFVLPAAEGCTGEDVHVYGTIDVVVQTTTTNDGSTHVVAHYTPHLVAFGLSSGTTYLAVGPTNVVSVDGAGAGVFTVANIILAIAPGAADDLILTETIHLTTNAAGETTVDFDKINAACRG